MYVILTSKPGQFRTEIVDGLRPLEAYDYLFYGDKKARFVIAELLKDTKIRVIERRHRDRQQGAFESSSRNSKQPIEPAVELKHLTDLRHMSKRRCKQVVDGRCIDRTEPS